MSAIIYKPDIDDNQPMTGDETDTEDVNFKYGSTPNAPLNNKSDAESSSVSCSNFLQPHASIDSSDTNINVTTVENSLENTGESLRDSFSKSFFFKVYSTTVFFN